MGNSIAKKRKLASRQSKKEKIDVLMTSKSLQNIVVEFPKEIEEDLERRKIESFKALAAAKSKKPPARTISAPPLSSSTDPAHDFYERARGLDVPAVMVPKPWSEVDQILSKLKPSDTINSSSPKPKSGTEAKLAEAEQQPETIDMSELMNDLDEEDEEAQEKTTTTTKKSEIMIKHNSVESLTRENVTPKSIRSLESSLSFSTIHTVKEVEGGNAKPESVTNILNARSTLDSSARSPAGEKSSSFAITPTTPRKVNVHPRLLARMEAFM